MNAAPEGSRACLQCHIAKGITGSAIRDWQLSKHFGAGVACANCHIPVKEASPGILNATTACEDKRVRRGVSPRNCAVCHADKFEQFSSGKHSVAWGAMISMPTTAMQPHALIEGMKGCGGCHRVGLDEGKCDSCHTRHRFSAAEARRPEACLTCHMGVDHPQWEMYSTSKHGAIYNIEGAAHWNWELGLGDWFKDPTHASPERPRTPVCATCHMPNGDHAVRAAWGFLGLRLPEKDPEWLQYRQKILVALGILTPDGKPTPRAQVVKVGGPPLTAEEWQAERDRMISVCATATPAASPSRTAALDFLAAQRQVDPALLAVFGHSQGGIYALLLASGLAGPAPKVRAIVLLEPVPMRTLDLIEQGMIAGITSAAEQGQITAAQALNREQAISRAIASLRDTGTLPARLPDGVAATFNRNGTGTLLELSQIDRYDPAAVAAKLPAHTAVLLTCSNADVQIGCAQVDHLAAGMAQASARLDYVHLDGVDHFLKEDISKQTADYNESLPFSPSCARR